MHHDARAIQCTLPPPTGARAAVRAEITAATLLTLIFTGTQPGKHLPVGTSTSPGPGRGGARAADVTAALPGPGAAPVRLGESLQPPRPRPFLPPPMRADAWQPECRCRHCLCSGSATRVLSVTGPTPAGAALCRLPCGQPEMALSLSDKVLVPCHSGSGTAASAPALFALLRPPPVRACRSY